MRDELEKRSDFEVLLEARNLLVEIRTVEILKRANVMLRASSDELPANIVTSIAELRTFLGCR